MARKSQLEKDYDTRDTTNRCSGDQRLRRYGFRVKSRPKTGPVLWERLSKDGQWVEYTEKAAHKYADMHENAVAEVGREHDVKTYEPA